MIAKCALDFATQENVVTVVSDDTDILVLLVCHWKINTSTLNQKHKEMTWKIVEKTLLKMLNCLHHIYSLSMHGVVVIPHMPHTDKAKHFYLKV